MQDSSRVYGAEFRGTVWLALDGLAAAAPCVIHTAVALSVGDGALTPRWLSWPAPGAGARPRERAWRASGNPARGA